MLCIQKNLTLQVIIKNVNIALNFSPSTIYLRSEVSPADPFLTSSDRPSHPSSVTLAALICICRAFPNLMTVYNFPLANYDLTVERKVTLLRRSEKSRPFVFSSLVGYGTKETRSMKVLQRFQLIFFVRKIELVGVWLVVPR